MGVGHSEKPPSIVLYCIARGQCSRQFPFPPHQGYALCPRMERGSNPRQEAHPLPLSLSPEGDSFSAASPPPPPPPPPQQGQEEGQQERWRARISYRVSVSINSAALSAGTLDDVCSCLVVLVTFCFFASMSLILGFYGSADLVLGPNSSRLLGAYSFFVQDIKVKTAVADSGPGPVLYGFSNPPPLDINTTWTQNHSASIPANSHREWIYYLNGGAQIDISYRVMKSQGGESSPLTLVIAQGKESIIQWIEEPSYPNSTLSWYSIHGNGLVQQKIVKPSDYYVAVGNLNRQKVEVILNFRVQAFLYNTTGAYYKCALHDGLCVLKLFFLRSDVAILATSVPEQDGERDEWYVKMSYGPRWITYFVGSGGMTIIMLLAFKVMTRSQSISGDAPNSQDAEVVPERTPLLTNKDDDTSSLGSSYDSVSHDEEDIEEWLRDAPPSAKSLKGDESINSRCLCAICFDAPVDCFFLPCGHCATCFPCGLRTIEEARTCPICSRKMKKVRKVLAV